MRVVVVLDWLNSATVIGWVGIAAVVVTGGLALLSDRRRDRARRIDYSIADFGAIADEASSDAAGGEDLQTAARVLAMALPRQLHLARLTLYNSSDEIEHKEFAGPLCFDLGVEIAAVLSSRTTPGNRRLNEVTAEGRVLKIGPAIIARHQSLVVTVLVDGPGLTGQWLQQTIERVDLHQVDPGQEGTRHLGRLGATGRWMLIAALAGALILVGRATVSTSRVTSGVVTTGTPQPTSVHDAQNALASADPSIQASGLAAMTGFLSSDPADQPTIIAALDLFVRQESASAAPGAGVNLDVQSALDLIDHRNPAYDDGTVVDLDHADLTNADLAHADLDDADLDGADLTDADLNGANLGQASFGRAILTGTSFSGANLSQALFGDTSFCSGTDPVHPSMNYTCQQ